jgi:hypothetical protein
MEGVDEKKWCFALPLLHMLLSTRIYGGLQNLRGASLGFQKRAPS